MSLAALLISFLYLLLSIAVVIFIAFCIVWACKWFGLAIDDNVFKWGKVIVGLICLILVVVWIFGALGAVVPGPRLFLR